MPYMPLEKKKHYWIWSEAKNRGKTTFIKSLEKYGVMRWCFDEKFQEYIQGQQILAFDGYRPPRTLLMSQLENICDGEYKIAKKGGGQTRPKDLIVVICSNLPPEEVYPNKWDVGAVRFNVINLD